MNYNLSTTDWEPCLPGTLAQASFVTPPSGVARLLAAPPLVTGAVVGFALAAIVFVAVSRRTEPVDSRPPGGIACATVHENLPAYVAGELTAELSEQMAIHLAACPGCRELHQQMVRAEQIAWRTRGQLLAFNFDTCIP